ncbi:MAG: hypothetical protein ACKPKO_19590, partial [Candidatus Fonsibacter sp.]
MNQNLALEAGPIGSLIHEHWHKWTVTLNPNTRIVWQALIIQTYTSLARVYRTGTTGLMDWIGFQAFSGPGDAWQVHHIHVNLLHCIFTN